MLLEWNNYCVFEESVSTILQLIIACDTEAKTKTR